MSDSELRQQKQLILLVFFKIWIVYEVTLVHYMFARALTVYNVRFVSQ